MGRRVGHRSYWPGGNWLPVGYGYWLIGTVRVDRKERWQVESLQYLTIYLNDHRAGAAAGIVLARRLWRKNRSGPWSAELRDILKLIKAEKEALDSVRAAVGVTGGQLKRVGALVAAQASRIKPNGHFLRYSPLTRLGELEALMSGVQSKLRLWAALEEAAASLPEIGRFDFVALGEQSAAELHVLGEIHRWAAREVFPVDSQPMNPAI